MSKAKVWKLIKKKKSYRKQEKKDSAMRRGPNVIVKEFLLATDDVRVRAPTLEAFYIEFYALVSTLEKEMTTLDPEVGLRVMWVKENTAETLDDLKIDGVEINWSRFYLSQNQFLEKTKIVDFAYLFVNGYFD